MALVFGAAGDPIDAIEARARRAFTGLPTIVWEGDPQTFQFSYVSADAEVILGYPRTRWINEPTFWVDRVVHPDDREDAVAYCALATAKGCHHTFEYRAVRKDGAKVWLRDVVCVILGPRRLAVSLRGIMFDVTAEKSATGGQSSPARTPSFEQLSAMT